MTDWIGAQQKAAKTARWSITMTRWLIARLKLKRSWKLVTFAGLAGGESAGIVDILAIRKDHRKAANGSKEGTPSRSYSFRLKVETRRGHRPKM
jgi:hypothetical protein